MSSSWLKSIVLLCLGAAPGIALFASLGNAAFLIVAALGGFIGLALSWPSTSIRNIGRLSNELIAPSLLTPNAGGVVANNRSGSEEEAKCTWMDLEQVESFAITPAAAKKLSEVRPSPELSVRLQATINKDIPQYLIYDMKFEDSFLKSRDLRCSLNGINFVIDQRSAQRMRKTILDWNESQQGFKFDSPEWPRLNLDREPWQDD
jgi:Fe-S cluster assembly iron-binding protein IscA